MRQNISILLLTVFLVVYVTPVVAVNTYKGGIKNMIENIHWLGHAGFRIDVGNKKIFIDPYKLKKPEKADIILITHEHFDHFSKSNLTKLQAKDTVVVTTKTVASEVSCEVKIVNPGDVITIDEIKIEAVPAYNTNKHFHPKSDKKLGFIIILPDNTKIYHAGDTDLIPEMEKIKVDIAMLPVSGTYVMTAEEAGRAALKINPKIAIPMHYGAGVAGTVKDAEKFYNLLKDKIEVKILKEE